MGQALTVPNTIRWDQTGFVCVRLISFVRNVLTLDRSNGANLSFPKEFGIGNGEKPGFPHQVRDNWLVGLVNAGPYIGSAFIGCWLSDPVNFYLGRRGTIFVSAVFCVLTPIGGK